MGRGLLGLVVAVAMLAPGTVSADQPTLLIEFDLTSGAIPSAVNPTGTVVVGGYVDGRAFYWMPTTGDIDLGGVQASGVSADGETIVGAAADPQGISNAAIWLRGTEWRLLGSFPNAAPCGKNLSGGSGTSRDGSVVVGSASNGCGLTHAFSWTESTGLVDLGSAVPGRDSRGLGVSGDGRVVVGTQEAATGFRMAARWIGGHEEVLAGPTGILGEAYGANVDGSVVVGRQCNPSDPRDQSAWVLTPSDGVQCLPSPARRPSAQNLTVITKASATSDDGRVIGGGQSSGGTGDSDAVIWINRSPAYLKDLLRANGLPGAFSTWLNTGEITDVSPDGRILVGFGAPITGFRGYMVILGTNVVMP